MLLFLFLKWKNIVIRNYIMVGLNQLYTYLTRLVKKGILHSEGKGYKCKRSYYPELTEQELAHKYATDFVDNTFNGSISDLLVSLTYNTKLSESDIEELKNIINNNTCD